ncbi:MAG: hypothetical protein GY906_18005 [bacterium]|nr:hypothetical protein [bacterium]
MHPLIEQDEELRRHWEREYLREIRERFRPGVTDEYYGLEAATLRGPRVRAIKSAVQKTKPVPDGPYMRLYRKHSESPGRTTYEYMRTHTDCSGRGCDDCNGFGSWWDIITIEKETTT